MSGSILYIDSAEVREGRLDELKLAMGELVELVESNEPQLGSYRVYFAHDGTKMTVIHAHVDSASLERHMRVAGPAFSGFVDLVQLLTIDLYGTPSDAVLDRIRDKAELLGNAKVTVHELHAGFTRTGAR